MAATTKTYFVSWLLPRPGHELMAEFFPWVWQLSPSDQRLCAREIIAAARVSAVTGQPELVISELRSWSETASATSVGLGDMKSGWLAVPEPVERP